MKIALTIVIFLSLGMLTGCSWIVGEDRYFDTKEYDYTRARMSKELEIPASVGEDNTSDNYYVPETDEDLNGIVYGIDNDVLAPMQVLTLGNKVRVNRDSKNASVYVSATSSELWDSVDRYLNEQTVTIADKDDSSTTLNTDWIKTEDDDFWSGDITAWRQRYNIVVGDATRPTEKKLTVTLLAAQEYVDDTKKWRDVNEPGRLETEFLNSILGFLYVEDIDRSRQLVNQSALSGITVSLGSNSEGQPALITTANFEHVWGRIPVFLRLVNISLEDQDRSQATYFFSVKDDGGFFESLAFWTDDGETLDLEEGLYTIKVEALGEQTSITFFDEDDEPLSAQVMAKNYPTLSKAFRSRVSE